MSWNTYYPRPQLRRSSFFPLNDGWQLNGRPINLPFPPESRLAGYDGKITGSLEYRLNFELPAGFAKSGDRIMLNFGAVDQIAEIFVNGQPVAYHEGGYLPFSVDITAALQPGENSLFVRAIDRLDHMYPYGKQKQNRGGMWYTPVSGIWQSVWLEAVPEKYIKGLQIRADMHGFDILIDAPGECLLEAADLRTVLHPDRWQRVDITAPHLWSPDDPYLYDLKITCGRDVIESYFALREIKTDGGKLLFNGRPLFINGVLDQGYFEDGIYLPGEPAEYERDIMRMKELGINLLRKHIKIEPEAFYFTCDRLGMLVMQDMVNSGGYNFILDTALPTIGLKRRPDRVPEKLQTPRMKFFTGYAQATVRQLMSHPCVVAYTIFNEGWGQFNADAHYSLLKSMDPTRLYDATSGWFRQKNSDFDSEHVYFRNKRLKPRKRPMLLSECGGYTRAIPGHMFDPGAKYGYGGADTEDALTGKIELMWQKMVLPAIPRGLCGIIYTQLSDVEDEINGLYTYDRAVCKVNIRRMRALAENAAALTARKE